MRSSVRLGLLALLVAAQGGTAAIGAVPSDAVSYGTYQDAGLSSWYGEELLGNRTASRERFDPAALTAAHRSLPLGSLVEVTSIETGRSVIVRINDRGPGRRDRIIDLSRAAAQSIGSDRHPTARVRIRTIMPNGLGAPGFTLAARSLAVTRAASRDLPARMPILALTPGKPRGLQVASYSNEARARALAKTLDGHVAAGGGFWRVRLGPFATAADLQRARDAVAARGYGDAQILPED